MSIPEEAAIAVSITAFAIIASCATSTGQARWMSCEVGEAERSISVFYGNADLDFVRGINLPQRCSRGSADMAELETQNSMV